MDEVAIEALGESAVVFAGLVRAPAVVDGWTAPSALEGYTVGGIAGHVLSLFVGLQARLDSGPGSVSAVGLTDWYGQALAPAVHTGLMEVGEDLAAAGPAAVADQLEQTGAELGDRLRAASPDVLIPLASFPGAGVPLDAFLRTRFVEIVVHADDVAASVGLPCPTFPSPAWSLAAGVITETVQPVGDDPAAILRVARPTRHGRT